MDRRHFIALTAGAAAAPALVPLAGHAQPRGKKIPSIGIIDDGAVWNPFKQALRDAGYIEGQTITFETRAAGGEPDRLTAAAAELVRLPVDVIATYGTPASRAAKAATKKIPIVLVSVGDPVRAGLVESLAHPGGNITGNTILSSDLAAKRLQLIKEAIPSASQVTLLLNPNNVSNNVILEEFRKAAPALGLAFTAVEARSLRDFDRAFAAIVREKPSAVLVTNDPLHQSHIQKIISLMFQNGLPGMFQTRDNVAAGGRMSYGASFRDLFRNGALYVQKILAGAKPGDLPVQPVDRFELAVNLKTAKAIGLKISEEFLMRVDEVIE